MAENTYLSRCCGDSPVNFHWFDGASKIDEDALEVAVERCLDSVSSHTRVWNMHSRSMVKAEFKNRIKRAALGKLFPLTQVATVGYDPEVPLFEIRWQTVNVTDRDPATGELIYGSALVRMYHSEPANVPDYFIGHHVHEKVVDDVSQEIARLQTAEIDVAKNIYRMGQTKNWFIIAG
ncbi:hypothetical protein [Glutamicibacter ardleyensis]|uniref:hypothetical protein n=1 Tax=Glutamicibacter ardleyensis TaxID=225894 RepID=UPI003FCF36F4